MEESYGRVMQGPPLDGPSCVNNEKIKMREINISELDNGYIIRVGCKSFAIERKDTLTELLIQYINNPQEMENKYYKNELFNE